MVAQLDRQYVAHAGAAAALRRAASYALFEGRPATTRGQWFNPVVRANLRLGERLGGRPVDRPVFVVGVGRSGTTHLGRLLSAHPEVGWLNEPKLMWSRIVPDEDVSGFYSPRGRFRLTADDATDEVTDRAHRMVGHYLRTVRATRLVDKYPELTYRIPFLKAVYPDCRIIAIVRDPASQVGSVLRWNQEHATHGQDWWGVGRRKWHLLERELLPAEPDLEEWRVARGDRLDEAGMAGLEWMVGARSLLRHRADLAAVVSYEQLVERPAPTIELVLHAAGLHDSGTVPGLATAATSQAVTSQAPAAAGPGPGRYVGAAEQAVPGAAQAYEQLVSAARG